MHSSELIPIEYGVYADSEAAAVAALLGEVFSRHDPPAVAVGLTTSEFEDFVRLLSPTLGAEGLTIVARHAETREVVGVLLTQDSASALPDGVGRLSPKFDPIFDILGQLDAEYRAGRAKPPGECLHLFLLGVSERVGGRGVGQQLVAACLELGAKKGYRLAVTEATNKVSQHIFRKQGFEERVRRSYRSHRFRGRAVFASIADQGGPALMDRMINS
jgi:ribosomal protein S18 acetylase RimI-like enzyme